MDTWSKTQQKQQNAIAVGYTISIPDDIKDLLTTESKLLFPDVDYEFDNTVLSGVFYHNICSGGHDPSCLTTSERLWQWYNSHKNKSYEIVIRKLYVTSKIIIGEAICANDRFCVVFYNPDNVQTTMLKKLAIRGDYGPPVTFMDRLILKATAYIYEKH
jgi:hypothetical protein